MQWTDLTIAERTSEKKRFDILASMGNEGIEEQLDEIEAEIDSLDDRVTRLEGFVVFTVTLTLKEDYENITVKFDGEEIEAGADDKYTITDVMLGMHTVEAHADGYGGYFENRLFTPDDCELEIELLVGLFDVEITTEPPASDAMTFKWNDTEITRTGTKYIIEDVEAGIYEIDIDLEGFEHFNETMGFTPEFNTYTAILTPDEDEPFTVTLSLAEQYPDIHVEFDGSVVAPRYDGTYVIPNVQAGSHRVVATCEHYVDFDKIIPFTKITNEYTITLEPEGFDLRVYTIPAPSSDMVFKFDDRTITPTSGYFKINNIVAGNHDIDITCTGYKDFHEQVELTGESDTLNILLEPEEDTPFTVTLSLADSYDDPHVYFDGDPITATGLGTYVINSVSTGVHIVECYANDCKAFSQHVGFTAYSNTYTIEMEPVDEFTLTINTTPEPSSAMQLRFDGRLVEATGNKFVIEDVTNGQHNLDIDCTGYVSYHGRPNVTAIHPTLNIVLEEQD